MKYQVRDANPILGQRCRHPDTVAASGMAVGCRAAAGPRSLALLAVRVSLPLYDTAKAANRRSSAVPVECPMGR
jgi:hypothetical protein